MKSPKLFSKLTPPAPPADLLARCLETIPATATTARGQRFIPDRASRARLRWLSVAAAVPACALLVVLPVRKWLSSKQEATVQTVETPLQNQTDRRHQKNHGAPPVPYVRVHSFHQQRMQNGQTTPPDYRVFIYDKNRGKCEWQTDARYETIKTPDDNTPFAEITVPHGKGYYAYWRAGKFCEIKPVADTAGTGPSDHYAARNPRWLAAFAPETASDKIVETKARITWEGRSVNKYTYRLVMDYTMLERKMDLLFRKSKHKLRYTSWRMMYPEWHSEAYVDPQTKLVQLIRIWTVYYSLKNQYPDGVLTEEKRFYYSPRASDSDYFDLHRITANVKMIYPKGGG